MSVSVSFYSLKTGTMKSLSDAGIGVEVCSYSRQDDIARSSYSNYQTSSGTVSPLISHIYRTEVTTSYILHTGFISDAQSSIISEELISSPYILISVTEDSLSSAECELTNTVADYKNNLKDGVVSYDLTFKLSTKKVAY